MCAGLPGHATEPETLGSPFPPQAWFRVDWTRDGGKSAPTPALCTVGPLSASPLSVHCLLSGVWKRLSSCLLWVPPARLPPACLPP